MTPKAKGASVNKCAPTPPHNADSARELRDSEYLEVVRESRRLKERGFKVVETLTL